MTHRFSCKLFAKREPQVPYFWIVRDESGRQIDRDQYSNDLRERYPLPEYELKFIQED